MSTSHTALDNTESLFPPDNALFHCPPDNILPVSNADASFPLNASLLHTHTSPIRPHISAHSDASIPNASHNHTTDPIALSLLTPTTITNTLYVPTPIASAPIHVPTIEPYPLVPSRKSIRSHKPPSYLNNYH